MSITLKRPMFRRGGEVNEGIMELAKPRRNFSTGTEIQEIFEASGLSPSGRSYAETAMKLANLGKTSDSDLLTNILIQGGLRGMSTAGKGGTLANLASAFEAPVGQALKQRTAAKSLGVAGAMKGLELGIKKDVADKAIEAKLGKKQFESGTFASRLKQVRAAFEGLVGEKLQDYTVSLAPKITRGEMAYEKGVDFAGLMKVKRDGTLDTDYLNAQPMGTVLLNPLNGQFFKKVKDPDTGEVGFDDTYLNQRTFEYKRGD